MELDLLWCVLIGYAFGNILTASLVGRLFEKDLFKSGSGNPGMTNTIKVLGKKAGIFVLLGDILKTCAAVYICVLLFPAYTKLIPLYTGCGTLLGHCFPIWHHFQGGKGVAVTAASFVLYWPLAGFSALAAGALGVLMKFGVKIAALLIDVVFMICMAFRFSWITFLPALFMAVLMAWLNLRPNRLKDGKPLAESSSAAQSSASTLKSKKERKEERIEKEEEELLEALDADIEPAIQEAESRMAQSITEGANSTEK